MAELEPTVAALPIEVRKDVETLQEKIAFAQEELKREMAPFLKKVEQAKAKAEKAQLDLARQAAFGAFDVVAPNKGEVTYAEYLASRPAEPTEGVVRVNGNYFKDAATGKRVRGDLYREQQDRVSESQTQAHYDRVIEKQQHEGKSLMYLAREAARARQEGDATKEEDIRALAAKQVSEIIHSNEGGDNATFEAREQEEMAHFDELVEAIPARLEKLAERRAAHAEERVDDAHLEPKGEGQPSRRKPKAESTPSQSTQVETYLGDERVEVKNSFVSPDGETVVEVVGADGKTSFVRKGELTEKEIEEPADESKAEASQILSGIIQDSATERLKTKLQGDGTEDEPAIDDEATERATQSKKEKKDKKAKSELVVRDESSEDTPDTKSVKKTPFISGNFHGNKRVTLVSRDQIGDEPETVVVKDESGEEYTIPGSELSYRTTPLEEEAVDQEVEPKVPGKELELFTGPTLAEQIAKDGPIVDAEVVDDPDFVPGERTVVETSGDTRFVVDSDGVAERERQETLLERAKGWFDRTKKVAGQKFWSGWERTKGHILNIGTNEDSSPAEVEAIQERNRTRYTAGAWIVGAVIVGGSLIGLSAAAGNANASEGPQPTPTSVDGPSPSMSPSGGPEGGLYGTPDDPLYGTPGGVTTNNTELGKE